MAERAIQTWKNHFKAGLATTDPKFPLTAWDQLIPQANITLNLLQSARSNPALSAYAYVYGNFNFVATPIAPPGTKVVAHMLPSTRGTWELNGEVGWYVGPALKHYRCVTCYFPKTRSTRVCETVTFFPHKIPFPQVSLRDHLKQAAQDIVTLLASPPTSTVPSLQEGDPVRAALLDIATQLNRTENIPDNIAPAPRVNTPTQTVLQTASLTRVPATLPHNNTPIRNTATPPRVVTLDKVTAELLQQRSTTPRRL